MTTIVCEHPANAPTLATGVSHSKRLSIGSRGAGEVWAGKVWADSPNQESHRVCILCVEAELAFQGTWAEG